MTSQPAAGDDDTVSYLWLLLFLIEGLVACIPAAQQFDSQSTEFALFVVILIWLAILGLFVLGPVIAAVWGWPFTQLRSLPRGIRAAVAVGAIAAMIAALIALGWLVTLAVVTVTHALLGQDIGLALLALILLSPLGAYRLLRWWSSRGE